MNKYNKINVKFLSVISYIGPLFLIGKFSAEKDCESVKFHVRQGEILFYSMIILFLFTFILDYTLSSILESLSIICFLLYIGIAVAWLILSLMGIASAFSASNTSLPLVGDLSNKITKK